MPSGRLNEIWADGDTAFGTFVSIPVPMTAEIVAGSGVDFVIVDRQHGLIGQDGLVAIMHGMARTGVAPLVRTAANDAAEIGWALDIGADGIIASGVHSVEDAEKAVAASRYPPAGRRSIGPIRSAMFTKGPLAEVDDQVICAVLIESVAAVEAIDEICDIDGLDAVFIGHNDLSIDLGVPFAFDDPRLLQAIAEITSACARAGIVHGRAAADAEEGARLVAENTPMVSLAADFLALQAGMRTLVRTVRGAAAKPDGGPA